MGRLIDKLNQIMQIDNTKYDGILIVNKNGIVEYSTWFGRMTNSVIPGWEKSIVGEHLTDFYEELSEETSTVLQTLKTGKMSIDEPQILTWRHYRMVLRGSTYPIIENGMILGAANVAQLLTLQYLKTSEYIRQKLYVTDDIITQNKKMAEIKELILEVSNSDSPVMIYGETGAGKELVAESIHSEGKRRAKNFIAQNCAAIPSHLLESMFFGTEKGGFTGAESREGLFEMADGGTLFHIDAYRLEGITQDLGFEECFDEGICVIEWSDFIADELPQERLEIAIAHGEGDEQRFFTLKAIGAQYEEILEGLA